MRGLGTGVTGDTMVKRIARHRRQTGRSGATDETIEDHGDAFDTGAQDRARHGGQFSPAETAQQVQTIVIRCAM